MDTVKISKSNYFLENLLLFLFFYATMPLGEFETFLTKPHGGEKTKLKEQK